MRTFSSFSSSAHFLPLLSHSPIYLSFPHLLSTSSPLPLFLHPLSLTTNNMSRPHISPFSVAVFPCIILVLIGGAHSENVYCTYYRDSNELTCGTVTCETHVPIGTQSGRAEGEDGLDAKLPRGWYRIGTLAIRHDRAWFNLYRRRATGLGYWDFYTQIPERNCIGQMGLHAGENIAGSVAVKDKRCFDRLVVQIERKSTTEKFDVLQCRKCIFNSCWLGTRTLHDQRTYLTNLRSY